MIAASFFVHRKEGSKEHAVQGIIGTLNEVLMSLVIAILH